MSNVKPIRITYEEYGEEVAQKLVDHVKEVKPIAGFWFTLDEDQNTQWESFGRTKQAFLWALVDQLFRFANENMRDDED